LLFANRIDASFVWVECLELRLLLAVVSTSSSKTRNWDEWTRFSFDRWRAITVRWIAHWKVFTWRKPAPTSAGFCHQVCA